MNEEDWANSWKEHFHSFTVGNLVIKPTWREWNAAEGRIIVEIDPGMAFGTGLHPTTRLMLLAMQEYVKPSMEILDLGCGSGILSIAAAKLGTRVTAVDISDVAADVARTNLASNGLMNSVRVEVGTIQNVADATYDVILANIIASVLIEVAPDINQALKGTGTVLASGIIASRLDEVVEAFERSGLEEVERRQDEDWFLLAAKPST